ncbi:hypothetical protein ACFL0M_04150 [Thermodesulfobacteriota bacterium]
MLRIVMDSKCHQTIRDAGVEVTHYGPNASRAGEFQGKRLIGLRDALHALNYKFDLVDLEDRDWIDAAVLIIAGRANPVSFTNTKLNKISEFSKGGDGLLLMGNHPNAFVTPQNQVSQRLNLPVTFQMAEGNSPGYNLLPHEISKGCESIYIRRFCRLAIENDPIASVIAKHGPTSLGDFAAAIEPGVGHSRLVVVGSAGHIASLDDSDNDLFSVASNAKWTLNMIVWLSTPEQKNA